MNLKVIPQVCVDIEKLLGVCEMESCVLLSVENTAEMVVVWCRLFHFYGGDCDFLGFNIDAVVRDWTLSGWGQQSTFHCRHQQRNGVGPCVGC